MCYDAPKTRAKSESSPKPPTETKVAHRCEDITGESSSITDVCITTFLDDGVAWDVSSIEIGVLDLDICLYCMAILGNFDPKNRIVLLVM